MTKVRARWQGSCLALALAGLLWLAGAQAAPDKEGRNVTTRVWADFEEATALNGWVCSPALRVAATTKGVTSGQSAMELTCVAADRKVKDDDRRAFLGFPEPLDISGYSWLAFDVTNPGSKPVGVYLTLYNPGAHSDWGYEGGGDTIPPGATRTVRVDLLKLGRAQQPMLDVSRIVRLGIGAGQLPQDDAVVCVDNLRLELDPAVGSPLSHLRARAQRLQQAYAAAVDRVPWAKARPEQQAELKQLADRLLEQVAAALAACEQAAQTGSFGGKYDEVNRGLHALEQANELGRLLLIGKPAFYTWQISPYVNVFRQEYPAPGSPALKRLDVAMARGEFRDCVCMVSNTVAADQQLEVSLETTDAALKKTTLVQEALYFKNVADQVVGGAHYRLAGPLTIPAGESRQLRLRFNARAGGLTAGKHEFVLRLRDPQTKTEQKLPGTVQVWDFTLPDPAAVMSNNTYAEFCNSTLVEMTDLMVKDMKLYGLNTFFVHPREVTVAQPDGGARFEFAQLDKYVATVMDNWGSGPRPEFIFSLGGSVMPPEAQLGEWVKQFAAVLAKHGLQREDWYFVFGDEANENLLLTFELPLGEIMRRAAPEARISTNTSAMISDPAARARYFATVDRWEPDLDLVHLNAELLPYLRPTGKPINLFRCRGAYSVRGANMYNYYRVYGWEAAAAGCEGMGVWTYCVDRKLDPWTNKEEQFTLVFRHPTQRDLVHSRRYETFREGIDDYRYLRALRDAAQRRGPAASAAAERLIATATADITAEVTDTSRCDKWRRTVAAQILKLQGANRGH